MASTLNGTHRAPAFYVPKVWNIKRKLWRYIWNIYKGKKLEKVYEIMGRISPTAIVIKPPAGWPFAKQTAVHFIVGACKQPLHRFLRCFSNWRKTFSLAGDWLTLVDGRFLIDASSDHKCRNGVLIRRPFLLTISMSFGTSVLEDSLITFTTANN